ncbi:MAG: ATP-dependent RecD-like DNA helicase [Myxococcota bacterium]
MRSFAFRASDGDFAVVRVELEDRAELVTAVGPLSSVGPGETLRLHGRWVDDPRFGRQIRVDGWLPATPRTRKGLERYLSSGAIEGIGPELAHRLVDRFGLDTFDVLDHHPERLTEVDGIGPVRARAIVSGWTEHRDARELMVLLRGHGVGQRLALAISRHFGTRALDVCRRDPYRLALEVPGVGFATADALARAQGLDPGHPSRLAAGALHVLAEAASRGHVCRPFQPWTEDAAHRLDVSPTEVAHAAHALSREGQVVIDDTLETGPMAYLPRLHRAERGAAEGLRVRLGRPPPPLDVDVDVVLSAHEAVHRLTLAEAQRRAVGRALVTGVLVITGGPGTGKTTLVRCLLAVYAAAELTVRLAAPTGRAAKRMEEATGHSASTLHRLLEVNPATGGFQRGPEAPLEADVVVVDEASMVDVALFCSLVDALPPQARLVLVGDSDQLPSVGPGRVLGDLIEAGVPTERLIQIFRQAEESLIVTNAHRIQEGVPLVTPKTGDPLSDFYVVHRRPESVVETVVELARSRIPKRFGLDPRQDVQVLTPMHRGPSGARALNQALQQALNPGQGGLNRGEESFRPGDKVMQTRNDYELGVLNGELGRVTAVDAEARTLVVDFDGDIVRYTAQDLEHLTLAYACSVHKAQGSEYPAVILVTSQQHAVMLDRPLFYTGVTRARQLLVVVASGRALELVRRPPREGRRGSALSLRIRAP